MTKGAKETLVDLSKNRGHFRLFLLLSLVWMIAASWYLWGPLPVAYTAPLYFGDDGVAACREVILDHADCVRRANNVAASWGVIRRLMVIIFVPVFLPVLALGTAMVIDWVREGYQRAENS